MILGAIAALFAWYVTKRIAGLFQDLIKIRKESLRVAERYWIIDHLSFEDTIAAANHAFSETSSSMRSEYRSLSWLAVALFSTMKYDFEGTQRPERNGWSKLCQVHASKST